MKLAGRPVAAFDPDGEMGERRQGGVWWGGNTVGHGLEGVNYCWDFWFMEVEVLRVEKSCHWLVRRKFGPKRVIVLISGLIFAAGINSESVKLYDLRWVCWTGLDSKLYT